MTVGVRELKANLSEYLARAASGEEIVVTDRNRPIARLVAYQAASQVDVGIEEGWIEPPHRGGLGPVERFPSSRSTVTVLAEDRE